MGIQLQQWVQARSDLSCKHRRCFVEPSMPRPIYPRSFFGTTRMRNRGSESRIVHSVCSCTPLQPLYQVVIKIVDHLTVRRWAEERRRSVSPAQPNTPAEANDQM